MILGENELLQRDLWLIDHLFLCQSSEVCDLADK